MTKKADYYDRLKFFFTRRWTDIDQQAVKQLDRMSDEEIHTLYDIVFAESEMERLQRIKVFYTKLESKENKALQYMSDFKKTMGQLLQELEEIWEKGKNEEYLDVSIAKI